MWDSKFAQVWSFSPVSSSFGYSISNWESTEGSGEGERGGGRIRGAAFKSLNCCNWGCTITERNTALGIAKVVEGAAGAVATGSVFDFRREVGGDEG